METGSVGRWRARCLLCLACYVKFVVHTTLFSLMFPIFWCNFRLFGVPLVEQWTACINGICGRLRECCWQRRCHQLLVKHLKHICGIRDNEHTYNERLLSCCYFYKFVIDRRQNCYCKRFKVFFTSLSSTFERCSPVGTMVVSVDEWMYEMRWCMWWYVAHCLQQSSHCHIILTVFHQTDNWPTWPLT